MPIRPERLRDRVVANAESFCLLTAAAVVLLAAPAASAPLMHFPPRPAKVCPDSGVLDEDFLRPFVNAEALDLLNCGLIQVQSGAFDDFEKLTSLSLADNDLRELHPDTFTACPELTSLDLSGNPRISVSANEPFLNSHTLQTLQLRNCGIHTVSIYTFADLPSLRNMDLHANPLCNIENCDTLFDDLRKDTKSISNYQEQEVKKRKPTRTLLISNEYLQWNPQSNEDRRKSWMITFMIIGAVMSLSVVVVGVVLKSRVEASRKRDCYQRLEFIPEEIVIPSHREDYFLRQRTSWKDQAKLVYVLFRYSVEYAACPVKM